MTSAELDELLDGYEAVVMEPRSEYDQYIVGVVRRFTDVFVVYDREAVLNHLADAFAPDSEDDPVTEAIEWFDYNMVGAWLGSGTYGFIDLFGGGSCE